MEYLRTVYECVWYLLPMAFTKMLMPRKVSFQGLDALEASVNKLMRVQTKKPDPQAGVPSLSATFSRRFT